MVEGIIEEKYANRSGLLSRLFTWSPETDAEERHIQMVPISPDLWADFQKTFHKAEEDKARASAIAKRAASGVAEAREADTESDTSDTSDTSYSSDSSDASDASDSSDSTGVSDVREKGVAASPFEMSLHESKSIESMLECVDKCRLDLLFASSEEWANTTLVTFINTAVHLAEAPYRSTLRRGQA